MNPLLDRLTRELTELIGPEAFAAAKAKAEAAQAAQAAAAAAAKPAAPATVAAGKPASPTPAAAPTAAAAPAAASAPSAAAAPKPVAPAPKPAAPAPVVPASPLLPTAHAQKGFDLDATVAPSQVVDAARLLDRAGFALDAVTGVDWLAQGQMEVVYDYYHPTEPLRVVVRTRVPRATPELPTICAVFPGANWHERETHDFFGLVFTGHPNLKPFILPEDATFHPLRKDYAP